MGLENNLVGNVQSGNANATTATGSDANPYWLSEAYFTYKAGKSVVKMGRQALPQSISPLAYSESWGAFENTFEAAAVINSDIPNTTLVGAYVSRGNGQYYSQVVGGGISQNPMTFESYILGHGAAGLGNLGGTDHGSGAYMIAAINSSVPGLTLAGNYYDVADVANAYWLSASYDAKVAKLDLIYAGVTTEGAAKSIYHATTGDDTTNAFAAKVSGNVAGVSLGASYSNVSAGTLGMGNTATLSKDTAVNTAISAVTTNTALPTAGVGGSHTGAAAGYDDTTGYKIEAGYSVAGVNLGAYYNNIEVGKKSAQAAIAATTNTMGLVGGKKATLSSYALTAGTKIDDLNLAVAYVSESNDKNKSGIADENILRVVASINF